MIEHAVLDESDDKVLVLCTHHSVIIETDRKKWSNYLRAGSRSSLGRQLIDLGLTEAPDTTQDLSQAMDFTNIILDLTTACNLDCIYCFRDSSGAENMSFAEFCRALDLIPRYFNKGRCTIQFFGGEPLLRFGQIKRMVAYTRVALPHHATTFSITTNCTLLTPAIAQFLAANAFIVTVSLDSFEDANSRTRPAINGDSQHMYGAVLDKIRLLISLGITITCNVVVTAYNVDRLAEFVLYMHSLGINRISLSLVSDKSLPMSGSLRRSLLEQEAVLVDAILLDSTLNVIPIRPLIDLLRSHELYLYRCGYGRLRVNITPHGDITPCQRVLAPMGTTATGIDMETSRNLAMETVDCKPVCRDCAVRYLCGGNCYHESLVYERNAHQPYRPYCAHFEELVSLVGRVLSRMDKPSVNIPGLKVF